MPKYIKQIGILSALYPLLVILSVYVTWVAGRFILGHWPRPMFDDPERIGVIVSLCGAISGIILSGVPLVLFFNIALNIGACIAYIRNDKSLPWNFWYFLATSIATWIGSFKFLQWDPLMVVEWFLD